MIQINKNIIKQLGRIVLGSLSKIPDALSGCLNSENLNETSSFRFGDERDEMGGYILNHIN